MPTNTAPRLLIAAVLIVLASGLGARALWPRTLISKCPGEEAHYFNPQPDITAYELALITMKNGATKNAVCFRTDQWRDLDPEVKRHFSPIGG